MIRPKVLQKATVAIKNTSYGYMAYNPKDIYVGRSIEMLGEYCPDELTLMKGLTKPGDVIIDAGANLGALTVPLAHHVGPGGHVVAIEPQPHTFALLCANIAFSECFHVRPIQAVAVGPDADLSKQEWIPILDPREAQNFAGYAVNLWGDERYNLNGSPVPRLRISDLKLKKIDLVKLDIEGMELEVLQDLFMDNAFHSNRPFLYVENNQEGKQVALLRYLISRKYKCHWHLPPLYRRNNYYNNPVNPWNADVFTQNMVCYHPDRPIVWQGEPLPEAVVVDDKCYSKIGDKLEFMPPTALNVKFEEYLQPLQK